MVILKLWAFGSIKDHVKFPLSSDIGHILINNVKGQKKVIRIEHKGLQCAHTLISAREGICVFLDSQDTIIASQSSSKSKIEFVPKNVIALSLSDLMACRLCKVLMGCI